MDLLTIVALDAAQTTVWRLGPWRWVDKEYAFTNRWDDIDRVFRTVYAGDSRYACFVEVLAYARPDRVGDVDVVDAVGIVEDEYLRVLGPLNIAFGGHGYCPAVPGCRAVGGHPRPREEFTP